MSELSPTLSAALAERRVLLFGAVEINLPSYDLCLLDGSGELIIGGKTFRGRDPVYGVIDTIKGLADGTEDRAPLITLGLIPASDASLAALVSPDAQGSPVSITIGAVNLATGQPVADPYAVFSGELDVPTVNWGENDRRLEYRVTGVTERLFQVEEGRRLSSSFHQKVWPNEKGLDFVTSVETILAWGQNVDNSGMYVRSNVPGYAETYNRT